MLVVFVSRLCSYSEHRLLRFCGFCALRIRVNRAIRVRPNHDAKLVKIYVFCKFWSQKPPFWPLFFALILQKNPPRKISEKSVQSWLISDHNSGQAFCASGQGYFLKSLPSCKILSPLQIIPDSYFLTSYFLTFWCFQKIANNK